jgi:hypothetical protein
VKSVPITGGGERREHLQRIVAEFMQGYADATRCHDLETLAKQLSRVDATWRGFAFEGASMALTLLDFTLPGTARRFDEFVVGPASPHVYMAHVGAGWAAARLRRSPARLRSKLDPLLGWLGVDGYGFHEGYFRSRQFVNGKAEPSGLTEYERRAFDQGLGRSLWFVDGADVERVSRRVHAFSHRRQTDLWSGVGLAACYAGGVGVDELQTLRHAAGSHQAELAQGAAFAAEARDRAGNQTWHTDRACRVFTGVAAATAASLVRRLRPALTGDDGSAAYERWRQLVGKELAGGRPWLAAQTV